MWKGWKYYKTEWENAQMKINWSNHIKQEKTRKKMKSSLNAPNDEATCKVQKLKIKCQYKAPDVL